MRMGERDGKDHCEVGGAGSSRALGASWYADRRIRPQSRRAPARACRHGACDRVSREEGKGSASVHHCLSRAGAQGEALCAGERHHGERSSARVHRLTIRTWLSRLNEPQMASVKGGASALPFSMCSSELITTRAPGDALGLMCLAVCVQLPVSSIKRKLSVCICLNIFV